MNIIPLGVEPVRDLPPTITIPLDNVETARTALEYLAVTAQVGLRTLDMIDKYGEAETMRGVRKVLAALSALLAE